MGPFAALAYSVRARLSEPRASGGALRFFSRRRNSTSCLLLEASGHEVQISHDGPSVLGAVLAFQPTVVLPDIGLPGLNGFDVAQRIRLQPALAGVLLIALTGYGHKEDRQRSQEAGFDHYLVKPAGFATLEEILASVWIYCHHVGNEHYILQSGNKIATWRHSRTG